MSTNALWLDGWDDASIWGLDLAGGYYYAQLTRNGNSDDDGPNIWITPPTWPAFADPNSLAVAIASATGAALADVKSAMTS